MTSTREWIERYEAVSWNNFGRRRLVLSHGEGSRVYDIEGREYLDFLAGIAVSNLGHGHPAIVEAIREQAARLIHCTNIYYIPAQIEWAEMLVANAFPSRICFANSGAEANEAMIKVARKYASENYPPGRRTIISCNNSFHGRTLATLTATGQAKCHEGFEPLMPGFKYVDYNDCGAMRAAVDDDVCAILVEPVQGEGGVWPATQEFMDTLAELRETRGVMLLFDEVQSGLGRTGRNFAYQHYGVEPDVMTLAKPIAGGVAAGAILARDPQAAVMTPGSHGGTMIGNPLAAAAGRAYCQVLFGEKLAERAAELGERTLATLRTWIDEVPCVREVRGMGLMLAVDLDRPGAGAVTRCEEKGLLINCTAGTVVRMLPPLNVSEEDVARALAILKTELLAEGD